MEQQITKWLKKLERESWQLELLVSGFTIFLLIGAYEELTGFIEDYQFNNQNSSGFYLVSIMLLYTVTKSIMVLTINLILHLALRGFWIGAIGLRSVGPTLDYDKLNYHQYYVEKLKQKMGSMDNLIVRLDRLCSVIFSFSFLIIFLFLSLCIYFLSFALVSWLFKGLIDLSPDWLGSILNVIGAVIQIFIALGGLLYMLDSLSLGLLKKVGWLRRIYYPIYVIFSTLTLSVLYRSIYYNLIAQFSKSALRTILLIYILLVIFMPFFALDDYRFYPDNRTAYHLSNTLYDDQRAEKQFILSASIPSLEVENSFIPLFIRYNPAHNDEILASCPGFEPAKKGGWKHGLEISNGNLMLNEPDVEEPLPGSALKCLEEYYTLEIDGSSVSAARSYFYTHPNRQEKGVMMLVDIANLSPGAHSLIVSRQTLQDSTLISTDYANIAFWKQ